MIESSIIKLILIVALNMCFVWVWVKKESLRRVIPFEFIRKLEEISFFKKIKKLISFIGNINIFWIINILYLVLIKVFEKDLNLILGFSEGTKKDLMIETNVLKSSYIYANSLDGVTKFLFDSGNFIVLFIGVTALMIPIYLYIIGFKSKSKRQLLLMLTKKGDMFYISFFIYIMLFFRVEKMFLIGAIGYLIYLLMEAVKWIMRIENSLYSFEGLDKILKLQEEDEIVELYNATLNELYQGVKDNNASKTYETQELLLLLLRDNIIKIENTKDHANTKNLIRTLYDIYDVSIKNQDDDIFHKISDLHMDIAQYYLKNNDKENFYWSLYGVTKVYDYYYKNGTDKFALDVVSGFRFDIFGIYEEYKEDFKEGKLWYSKKFRAIVEGIKKTIENNDLYFFKQFTYLIEQEFEYKKNLNRDYKLFEKSVYFGVLLYLREDKRKRRDDRVEYKKIDEFIRFMEKRILNNTSLIDLIELYEFIGIEMINNRGVLNWESYFEPEMELVKATVWDGREKNERDKLFFELLGKIRNLKVDKNRLLDNEYSERYFERKASEDKEKSIERIDKFKANASWLLSDLKNNRDKIDITKENYKEVEDLLIKLKNETEEKEKEKIRESEISQKKITLFKKELEKILSKSRMVKWFDFLGKYKDDIQDGEGKSRYISQYIQKEYFVELGGEGGTKAIAESYGKGQNKAIEQIMIDKLDLVAEDTDRMEDALKNLKGEPWIVLTGIGIDNFFYEESGKRTENIVLRTDLDKEYFEKYGEILEGIYKYKGVEIPIYNFTSDKKGIYILDLNDIEGFVHYDAKEEDSYSDSILNKFDDNIGYAYLKITDTKDIIEAKGEEEVLKYGFLKGDGTPEEKIEKFRQRVLVSFVQKGELKLKDDTVVYRVEFNG